MEDQNEEIQIEEDKNVFTSGDDNQIVGQEYEGEEQEIEAEGEAEGQMEDEEGMVEEDENHQNDGEEEIHQVHHENEEIEVEGEENVEGDEDGEQIEERDSLKKTMTQNIGDDVIQIAEYPNNIYYDKENFCDYKP